MIISDTIKKHLLTQLSEGSRFDGRKFDEFREVKVERGLLENAEGSAQVTVGDTIVLAGVKLSLEKPYPDTPDQGNFMVNAELTPMASPEFEFGPPSIDSIELARVVDRGIREAGSIDIKKLCIKEGEKVWSVGVDIIPINDAGNLMDVSALAALAAIQDARFPEIDKEGNVNYKKRTTKKLPLVKEPIAVTVHLIGEHLLVDPSPIEEKTSGARLTIASLDDKTMCAMQKGGEKPITLAQIDAMVELALKKAGELRKAL